MLHGARNRRERNRMHAKLTRDRKKLFTHRMQQMISALERHNLLMRSRLGTLIQGAGGGIVAPGATGSVGAIPGRWNLLQLLVLLMLLLLSVEDLPVHRHLSLLDLDRLQEWQYPPGDFFRVRCILQCPFYRLHSRMLWQR